MPIFPIKKSNIYVYPLIAAVISRLLVIPYLDLSKSILMEYGIIARNILSGSGYAFTWFHSNGTAAVVPTAYMPPGQVFVQLPFLSIFGDNHASIIAIFFFQVIQACAFIYMTGKITDIVFGSKKITLITIWVAALYPPFIYVTMTFGVTSSALLLNALILYIGIRFSEALRSGKEYVKYSLIFGVSCGLLLVFRGESPLIVASTMVLLVYMNRKHLRRTLKYTSLSALLAIAILAPWTIRNYIEFNRFIPTSTNGGFNFWRGNNALTTGSPWTETGGALWSTDEIWNEIEPHLDRKTEDFDKINSDVHTREALKWIKENPAQFAALSLKKALILWTVDIRSKMGGTVAYIIIYAFTFTALLTGIFFIRRNRISTSNPNSQDGFRIMLLWCTVMTLTAMIFFPLPRFQVLLIGIYFPVIGYGISETVLLLKRRKKHTTN